MLGSLAQGHRRANAAITAACTAGAVACLGVMTVVILLQVFFRYVLNAPLSWPEEIARFLMVWMTFLSAPYAYRSGAYVRLETWIGRFPKRLRRFVDLGTHVALIVLFAALFERGLWMVERGSVIRASTIDIPMAWIFLILPVTFAILISVAIESLYSEPQSQESQS